MENEKNKKHIENVYADKAMNLLKICVGALIFSIISYFIPFSLRSLRYIPVPFDFGLIFEIISFIFILIAINKIKQNNLQIGKMNIIIAMLPIGFIIIYDLINLVVNINEVMTNVFIYYTSIDYFFYPIKPYLFDAILIISIILLYKAYGSLSKADGSKKLTIIQILFMIKYNKKEWLYRNYI